MRFNPGKSSARLRTPLTRSQNYSNTVGSRTFFSRIFGKNDPKKNLVSSSVSADLEGNMAQPINIRLSDYNQLQNLVENQEFSTIGSFFERPDSVISLFERFSKQLKDDLQTRNRLVNYLANQKSHSFQAALNSGEIKNSDFPHVIANFFLSNDNQDDNASLINYLSNNENGSLFLRKFIKQPDTGSLPRNRRLLLLKLLPTIAKNDEGNALVAAALKKLSKSYDNSTLIPYILTHEPYALSHKPLNVKSPGSIAINDILIGRATLDEAKEYLAANPTFSVQALVQAKGDVFKFIQERMGTDLRNIRWTPNEQYFPKGSLLFWRLRLSATNQEDKHADEEVISLLKTLKVPDDRDLDPSYDLQLDRNTLEVKSVSGLDEEEILPSK